MPPERRSTVRRLDGAGSARTEVGGSRPARRWATCAASSFADAGSRPPRPCGSSRTEFRHCDVGISPCPGDALSSRSVSVVRSTGDGLRAREEGDVVAGVTLLRLLLATGLLASIDDVDAPLLGPATISFPFDYVHTIPS
jgi:hypothetical protein